MKTLECIFTNAHPFPLLSGSEKSGITSRKSINDADFVYIWELMKIIVDCFNSFHRL